MIVAEPEQLIKSVSLYAGDCLAVLASLDADSVDSCVTDPPYHLQSIHKRFAAKGCDETSERYAAGPYGRTAKGFMGKQWDGGDVAFRVELWREVFRVLKPGAHLIAFSGTRTYHRMACAIEDAGFEIRDSIYYHYGSGFPKSHNISRILDAKEKRCACPTHLRSMWREVDASESLSGGAQQSLRADLQGGVDITGSEGAPVSIQPQGDSELRALRSGSKNSAIVGEKTSEEFLLQSFLSGEGGIGAGADATLRQGPRCVETVKHSSVSAKDARAEQSVLEGRGDVPQASRELRQRKIRPLSDRVSDNGKGRRIPDGASSGDGSLDSSPANQGGVRSPQGSSSAQQCSGEPGIVAVQPQPQERGAWPHCGRCGKPIIPDGLGTALKPATEPICLARKPLIGTVAENVLAHGTGALNIDGCRVGFAGDDDRASAAPGGRATGRPLSNLAGVPDARAAFIPSNNAQGRWPANIVHDGSDEVVAAFPQSDGQQGALRGTEPSGTFSKVSAGPLQRLAFEPRNDSGSAARFFYTAKADSDDRLGSKHPTVKPLDLMQWLVRLVTPPNGLVLDPFAGTGTTGEAAWREGMRAVLIEREAEYQNDIRRRMALALAGPDERQREALKARGLADENPGPLFAGATA